MPITFRNIEEMIKITIEDLKMKYNEFYSLKGIYIPSDQVSKTNRITSDDLAQIKYYVDTKLSSLISQAIELKKLINDYNERNISKQINIVRIPKEARLFIYEDEFGNEEWNYIECLNMLNKIVRLSGVTTIYSRTMCDTVRRPLLTFGSELRRIEKIVYKRLSEQQIKIPRVILQEKHNSNNNLS